MSQSPTKRSQDDEAESSSVASSFLENDCIPRSKKTKVLPPWGLPLTATSKEAPESLRAVWKAIDRYDKGIGIIGHLGKDAVEAAQKTFPEYEQDVFESFYEDQPGARTALGPTPTSAGIISEYADANGRKIDFYACLRPEALAATAITTTPRSGPPGQGLYQLQQFPPL
ncbi:hypothetical protein CkaCkLH20_13039 [Colletotrichum karsti]|uniref:Uncharacterized protein n=1 Tax=Colletotrichum karsti TaxID=1095194 RepID=A0A9P6HVC9_9PEZI|nr:uncharacterized protein CkaCkLH20_13039 [Colletotrichum karsti]KAF9869501.1 hypothetical protein CkaCkLH20_13039 [Colletotrichum karsti]